MKRFYIFLITGLLSLSTLTAQEFSLGFEMINGRDRAYIPFERYNNLIVIQVLLNKTIPLKFVLDTGVRTALLTDKTFADVLNISYDRKVKMVGADGVAIVTAYVANDISLELPGIVSRSQSILILEEDYLKLSNTLGTDIHGILGFDLFSRFVVQIDYDDDMLIIHQSKSFTPKKAYSRIPLSVEDTKPYISVVIKSLEGDILSSKLMVDTGASHSLLLNVGSDDQISLPKVTVRGHIGRGLGGDIDGDMGRVSSIQIGEFIFDQVIASYPDESAYSQYLERTGRQGTLGGGILGRFTAIFDYNNQMLYLKKNSHYNFKFEYNMSGIDLMAMGESFERIMINSVDKGSSAETAGLQKGDEIKLINGQLIYDLNIHEINNLMRSKDNRTMKLVINRDGEILRKSFKLRKVL